MGVSYGELSALKGKLKRAAIDAYMKEQLYHVEGDKYHHTSGDYTVTRPSESGEGGGQWDGAFFQDWLVGDDKTDEFTGAFNDIREDIDYRLQFWEDLPDPGGFDDIVEQMRQANRSLAVTAALENGEATGASDIDGNLKLIGENSDAMAGGIITAFKSKFLGQLPKAIAGHHGISVILGQALTAEQELWKRTRKDIPTLVHEATKAYDAYATGSGGDYELEFTAAGAVVAGVTAFASGGATALLAGAATGLQILSALDKESQKNAKAPPSTDYDGLTTGFHTSLLDLHEVVRNEEEGIEKNLTTNMENIENDMGSYDLTNPMEKVDDDSDLSTEKNGDVVIYKQALVTEITNTYMPSIATDLESAAEHADTANDSHPFIRNWAVGTGQYGAFGHYTRMHWGFKQLLGDLSWEVRAGGKTLDLAIADMGQTDTEAKDELEKHAEKVGEGSGYYPSFPDPNPHDPGPY